MSERHDSVLSISIPTSNKLCESSASKPSGPREILRSRAAAALKDYFGDDCWPLKESRSADRLELRVSIRTTRLEEFRKKIAELGFNER